ncbi:MAG TPA: agmatine deiminase family protein [Oleiagrimonas sp.]|nr:agmatine deiminase family protein [Oleiagrimonas sp.]
MNTPYRLPAEWEPQRAVVMAWPHAGTDWAPRLAQVEATCTELARAIALHEDVIVCVADAVLRDRVHALLSGARTNMDRVRLVEVAYDDTWLRDSGPITLRGNDGTSRMLDFRFTGWGGKYAATRDDALTGTLARHGVLGSSPIEKIDWALEGGAIESDGHGTLLTTWRCLHQRHPDLDREAMTALLRKHLAVERVLWLDHGYLQGDDTDAHIDTLARFAPDDAIVYQACDDVDDVHHAELARMADELSAMRTRDRKPYTLHALPWPRPIVDDGRRLPASYANYLVINDAVLVPAYDDPADTAAADIIGAAHPGRSVIQVPCRSLIWQNGSLHCMTMQLPE